MRPPSKDSNNSSRCGFPRGNLDLGSRNLIFQSIYLLTLFICTNYSKFKRRQPHLESGYRYIFMVLKSKSNNAVAIVQSEVYLACVRERHEI